MPQEYNPKTDQNVVIYPNQAYSSWVKLRRGECIEDQYADGQKYWMYFFDADTISVLSWDTIRLTNRGILERRLIDLEYLKKNGFRLVYE